MVLKSLKRTVALLSTVFVFAGAAHANIVDSITEQPGRFDDGKGGADNNRLEVVSSPVRAGQRAFKHTVTGQGERSEFYGKKTKIGDTYWYAWSVFFPSSLHGGIITQFPTYPTNKNFRTGCGAVGSYIIAGQNEIEFRLQVPEPLDVNKIKCVTTALASRGEAEGKWVDFVMNVKWTGNNNGFVKLWRRVGNGSFIEKIDYNGATYWNDEGNAPYFKMGLYKGDPQGGPADYLYTDEYRLGDSHSSFQEVAVGGSVTTPTASTILLEAEDMVLTDYQVESNSDASSEKLIRLPIQSQSGTAFAAFKGKTGEYDVYAGYFDENDGVGRLRVRVDGTLIGNFPLDQELGADKAVAKTFVRRKLARMTINKGAPIYINGRGSESSSVTKEFARVDYLEFVPVP